MQKPIIGVTMGDPSGIGPEVCLKALSNPEIQNISSPIIIGDYITLLRAAKYSKLVNLKINPIKDIRDADFGSEIINVLDLGNVEIPKLKIGHLSPMCGKAAMEYVEEAIKLATSKKIAAIATAPINKEAIHKAGYKFAGHTEILAHHTKTKEYGMMFVAPKFWLMLVTTHVALKDVAKGVTKKSVLRTIKLAHKTLTAVGKKAPRIGVAGLNPHAGEGGIFGNEEKKYIAPAIAEAKTLGIKAYGPISPDAIFNLANAGLFDLVVAMYHDQGLIPLKLLSFNKSVNVTVGLPIIRTSVDHGTGFDIAGKGIASSESMIQAIKVAASLARSRK